MSSASSADAGRLIQWAGTYFAAVDHVVQAPDRIASRFRPENLTFAGETLVKNNCNFFRLRGALFEEVFVYKRGDNSLG